MTRKYIRPTPKKTSLMVVKTDKGDSITLSKLNSEQCTVLEFSGEAYAISVRDSTIKVKHRSEGTQWRFALIPFCDPAEHVVWKFIKPRYYAR